MFKRKYTVYTRDYPPAKLVDLLVDRMGAAFIRIKLPDGKFIDAYRYKVTRIEFGGWFMRWIYRKADLELPDVKDKIFDRMTASINSVKRARADLRMIKIMRSKKREKRLMKQ